MFLCRRSSDPSRQGDEMREKFYRALITNGMRNAIGDSGIADSNVFVLALYCSNIKMESPEPLMRRYGPLLVLLTSIRLIPYNF
jgi:hypothetical protein